MPSITVTPKYVNPAKEGKKYGSIKTDDDRSFWVAADMVGTFRRGEAVTIEFEPQRWGTMGMVDVVTRIGGSQPAPTPQARAMQAQAPAPEYAPPNNKDRHIFVCGAVNSLLGTGKFGPEDIQAIAISAADAYDRLSAFWETSSPAFRDAARKTAQLISTVQRQADPLDGHGDDIPF